MEDKHLIIVKLGHQKNFLDGMLLSINEGLDKSAIEGIQKLRTEVIEELSTYLGEIPDTQ